MSTIPTSARRTSGEHPPAVAGDDETRSLLAAIVESSEDAIISKDLSGVVRSWNRSAERIFGYRSAEIIGRPIAPLIPPERRNEEDSILRRIARGERIDTLETQRLTKHGVRIDVSATISPVRNADGAIIGASGVLRDITQRKRDEAALRDSETRKSAILESALDCIVTMDEAGRITEFNPAAERTFGWPRDRVLGRTVAETLIPERNRAAHAAGLARFRETGERRVLGRRVELDAVRADGSEFPVELAVSATRLESGALVYTAYLRDITERRRAEAELLERRDRLEAAVRERTDELEDSHQRLRVSERMAALGTLSAGIGHDMGNLLLPLRIRLDALERTALTPERAADVAAIRSCAEYLQRLASSLRLLATGADSDPAGGPTSLAPWWNVAEPMIRTCLPRVVRLEAAIDPDAPHVALAGHELTQLVFNLVQNAGHACAGRPDPLVRIEARAGGADRVVLTVTDNGAGMSEDVRARCLEPFFTTRTRSVSTGLGLSLVAGIVDRAHGLMEIDSAPDLGTRFAISLPCAPPQRPASRDGGAAWVALADPRIRALILAALDALGVRAAFGMTDPAAWLLVSDPHSTPTDGIERFLGAHPARRALIFGGTRSDRVTPIEPGAGVAVIREALRLAVTSRAHAGP